MGAVPERIETPARVKPGAMPFDELAPRVGSWFWTGRAGFESHLYEELAWAGVKPRMLGTAVVESDRRPQRELPAFARAGFEVVATFEPDAAGADAIWRAVAPKAGGRPVYVQAWTVDTERANVLSNVAEALGKSTEAAVPAERRVESMRAARDRGALLLQICVVNRRLVVAGIVSAGEALSLFPGGRARMWRESGSVSRAALKVEEALASFELEPGGGETCVDLGAAPGGWTQRLVARNARVIAVDPANLSPELARHRLVTHVKSSAFSFAPEEPVDWLFCDMAWRPLEVAQLLGKWGRRAWATFLVANIKLPMKDKNPILYRVKTTLLQEGAWKDLRVRQLYHDRDEVTVLARRQ